MQGFDLSTVEQILANYENSDTMTLKPYKTRVYMWE